MTFDKSNDLNNITKRLCSLRMDNYNFVFVSSTKFLYIFFFVAIGTLLLFYLIKINLRFFSHKIFFMNFIFYFLLCGNLESPKLNSTSFYLKFNSSTDFICFHNEEITYKKFLCAREPASEREHETLQHWP